MTARSVPCSWIICLLRILQIDFTLSTVRLNVAALHGSPITTCTTNRHRRDGQLLFANFKTTRYRNSYCTIYINGTTNKFKQLVKQPTLTPLEQRSPFLAVDCTSVISIGHLMRSAVSSRLLCQSVVRIWNAGLVYRVGFEECLICSFSNVNTSEFNRAMS